MAPSGAPQKQRSSQIIEAMIILRCLPTGAWQCQVEWRRAHGALAGHQGGRWEHAACGQGAGGARGQGAGTRGARAHQLLQPCHGLEKPQRKFVLLRSHPVIAQLFTPV